MTSGDSCPTKPQEPNAKPCESGAPAAPCAPPPPPPSPESACPQPPPCPNMAQSTSIPTCPPILDPNNPCNYCPPSAFDTDNPDLTKLKKLQCMFQEEDDIPVYLKKGTIDAVVYQVTLVLVLVSLSYGLFMAFKIAK